MNVEVKNESNGACSGRQQIILPFKTCTGLELVTAAPKKYVCLVDGFLRDATLSMLCAKPKCGKSTLLRQLAVAIAEGRDFFGKPTQCCDVLYLSLEGPLGVIQEHLKTLGLTEQRGVVHVVHEQMPYRGEFGLQRLEKTIQSLPKLKLVIVDPVVKLLRMADSDSYDESSLALEKLEQLAKKHSVHLMFSTHGKKRTSDDVGDSPIGSTGFRGSTDTNIFLRKDDGSSKRIISTEQRWGVALEPTFLNWSEETKTVSLGESVATSVQEWKRRKEQSNVARIESEILEVLRDKGEQNTRELLEQARGKTATILSVLEGMVRSGKITATQESKETIYSRATIPVEGEEAA